MFFSSFSEKKSRLLFIGTTHSFVGQTVSPGDAKAAGLRNPAPFCCVSKDFPITCDSKDFSIRCDSKDFPIRCDSKDFPIRCGSKDFPISAGSFSHSVA